MATTKVIAEAAHGAVKSVREDKDSEADEKGEIEQKEFFWDQFVTYISTAILALTVLNVSVEFLRGGGVTCFPPTSARDVADSDKDDATFEISRSQSDYLNNFCSHSIPRTEYFPIFILAQGFLLVTPHLVWKGLFKGDFDSFIAVSGKLDRLRDRNTGEYSPSNFDRVEKLELEFGGKRRKILWTYYLKLIVQAAVCIGSILLSSILFVNYSFSFDCPKTFSHHNIPDDWPLNTTIPCVYTSLRVLGLVRFADYILIVLALGLVLLGFVWCFIRHTKELGHIEIATFVFASSLPASSYVFPRFYKRRQVTYSTKRCFQCFCFLCHRELFTPRMQSDLDFLVMQLSRADPSHGRVFKEILIETHLRLLRGDDHEKLHLFRNVKLDREVHKEKGASNETEMCPAPTDGENEFRMQDFQDAFRTAGFRGNPEETESLQKLLRKKLGNIPLHSVSGIRDRIYGFVKLAFPKINESENYFESQTMAMDISFGSNAYALTLARAFHNVISVNFHQFFRNEATPIKSEYFYTNYVNVHFPEDVFSQKTETINQAVENMTRLVERTEKQIDFIVIGPFTDANKIIKVTLAIEMLYTGHFIASGAILLAVRPLMIGHRDVSKLFCKYQPPALFDGEYHWKKVHPIMKKGINKRDFVFVGNSHNHSSGLGIVMNCGGVRCVFEFLSYEYVADAGKLQPAISESTFIATDV